MYQFNALIDGIASAPQCHNRSAVCFGLRAD
jgi:hypothetical protein